MSSPVSAVARLYSRGEVIFRHVAFGLSAAVVLLGTAVLLPVVSAGADSRSTDACSDRGTGPVLPARWLDNTDIEWGGQLTLRGTVSWPDGDSVLGAVSSDPYYDGSVEGRLKGTVYFGEKVSFETHYEIVLSGGDTRRASKKLDERFPALFGDSLVIRKPIDDDRRFLDLTGTLDDEESYILYHRLDRLLLTWRPDWGAVRVGRQAVTWGNGLLFNPMDLFNPFAPTDIERDYKVGDDMLYVDISTENVGNLQMLYVARRDPADGEVKGSENSLAAKLHVARGATEFDLMAAKHYEDAVAGAGVVGYLGGAAWRTDVTWTFLNDEEGLDGYLSFAANIDYSWVWWAKNWYGFIELYHNGLGEEKGDYAEALSDPNVAERLDRGELFILGRYYLAGTAQLELHPLFNLYCTVITNLQDPSGTVQPRAVWDVAQDVELTFGGTLSYGGKGTEFGGCRLPGTGRFTTPPPDVFLWATWYF